MTEEVKEIVFVPCDCSDNRVYYRYDNYWVCKVCRVAYSIQRKKKALMQTCMFCNKMTVDTLGAYPVCLECSTKK